MKEYKGYLAFDFDAVISTYKRPFILDKLGEPVKEVIETMRYYYNKGYYILIFTGRKKTLKMAKWLYQHDVPYHGFNICPKIYKDADKFKPYFNVLIDDKSVNFDFEYNRKTKHQLIEEINRILKKGDKKEMLTNNSLNYYIELTLLNDTIEYFIKKRFALLRKIAKLENKEPKK